MEEGIVVKSYKTYCLVCGKGKDFEEISSFDSALINAGIGNYNLVKISSILPAGCKRTENIAEADGTILYTAYITKSTRTREQIAVAVAVAIPQSIHSCGVIIKYAHKGSKDAAEKKARLLAIKAMEKRSIPIDRVEVIGSEIIGEDTCYSSVFAGLVLLE